MKIWKFGEASCMQNDCCFQMTQKGLMWNVGFLVSFVCNVVSRVHLWMWCPLFPALFIVGLSFPLVSPSPLCHKSMDPSMWAELWTLCPVPLGHVPVFVQILHSFGDCSFTKCSVESGRGRCLQPVLFSQGHLG